MPRITPISDQHCSNIQPHSDIYIRCIDYFSQQPELIAFRQQISTWIKGKDKLSILNIGCDFGNATRQFAEYTTRNSQVTGIDTNTVLISRAAMRTNHPRATFTTFSDLSQLSYKKNTFDLIYIERILHDNQQPIPILEEAIRVLKPSGRMIICEPDLTRINCNNLDDKKNQQLQSWIKQRVTCYDAVEQIQQYLKKSKLKLIQQDELWIEIDDYLQLNEFISFETMLTFLGYDLPEAEQITKQLQHDANQHLFKLKLPLTIFYLE